MSRLFPLRDPLPWLIITAIVALALGTVVPTLVIDRIQQLPRNHTVQVVSRADGALIYNREQPGPARIERLTATAPGFKDSLVDISSVTNVFANTRQWAHIQEFTVRNRESAYQVTCTTAEVEVKFGQPSTGMRNNSNTREGLQYFFPADTEKRSYPYLDPFMQSARPIDYLKESSRGTLDTFIYQHTIAPVKLADALRNSPTQLSGPALAAAETVLTGPAQDFYTASERDRFKLGATTRVVLEPYYSVEREVEVEPITGTVMNVRDNVSLLYATDAQQAAYAPAVGGQRAILVGDFEWDAPSQATVEAQVKTIVKRYQAMQVLSWCGKAIAVACALAATGLFLRRRSA